MARDAGIHIAHTLRLGKWRGEANSLDAEPRLVELLGSAHPTYFTELDSGVWGTPATFFFNVHSSMLLRSCSYIRSKEYGVLYILLRTY
jgi:hypothetical protein